MSLSPNGERSLFLRSPGNVRMDMNGVERLDLTALGGAIAVTVDDMSGTDFRRAVVDLSAPTGGADGDSRHHRDGQRRAGRQHPRQGCGCSGRSRRAPDRDGGRRGQPIDQLVVDAGGSVAKVTVDPAVSALIGVAVELGSRTELNETPT